MLCIKKKILTNKEKNEQQLKDETVLKEQLNNFELYKKYVEPVYSKIFEQLRYLITFLFILNGSIILTAITFNNVSLEGIIKAAQNNLYLLIIFILYLIIINFIVFRFLDKKKSNKKYLTNAYSYLISGIYFSFFVCIVQLLNFLGIIANFEKIIRNILQ